jgi:hypothetical protein
LESKWPDTPFIRCCGRSSFFAQLSSANFCEKSPTDRAAKIKIWSWKKKRFFFECVAKKRFDWRKSYSCLASVERSRVNEGRRFFFKFRFFCISGKNSFDFGRGSEQVGTFGRSARREREEKKHWQFTPGRIDECARKAKVKDRKSGLRKKLANLIQSLELWSESWGTQAINKWLDFMAWSFARKKRHRSRRT